MDFLSVKPGSPGTEKQVESKKQHIKYCGNQSLKHNDWIKVFKIIFKNTEGSNKHQGGEKPSCNLYKGYISCCSLKHVRVHHWLPCFSSSTSLGIC